MPSTDQSQVSRGYTVGHALGKRWAWVLGAGAAFGVIVYANGAHTSVEKERVAAEERDRAIAHAARQERERAASEAATAAASAAAEAAKTPEQRAREARAAAEAQRAEAKKREARAKLDAKISAMKWWDQCMAWGREARTSRHTPWREALIDHLTSEQMLNGHDLSNVTDRTPAVGMTTCGVYAQLGLPNASNATTTAHSMKVQMVYRDRAIYVYTRAAPDDGNGVVEAVQH
jgi:hypothetical protein